METAEHAVLRYREIKENLAEHPVTLVGVTKTVSAEVVNAVVDAGLTVIGENRVQEFLSKYEQYHLQGVSVHFIGSLQRNKVKYIIDKVDMIQSVDSIPLAAEIAKHAQKCGKVMPILLEVNIDGQESKSGFSPEALRQAIDSIRAYQGVVIKGLMCIPDPCKTPDSFVRMRALFDAVKEDNIPGVFMEELSMGMSGDYKEAVGHGATMVRVGSGIFGRRVYPGA